MNAPAELPRRDAGRFRTKLVMAMMLVVTVTTGLTLYFAERNLADDVERDLRRDFQAQLAALHDVQELRHAALVQRCRVLARRPRIHAAFEDGALDLLYPSAKDELRDIMEPAHGAAAEDDVYALHAQFYRFLDERGAVLPPPRADEVGRLRAEEENALALPGLPERPQLGYLRRTLVGGRTVLSEIIAMPIVSTESGTVIAALVLGFEPATLGRSPRAGHGGIRSGIWLGHQLQLDGMSGPARGELAAAVGRALATQEGGESNFSIEIGGEPHLVFFKQLNDASRFPPAYEVSLYPLADLRARQRLLRWQVVGAGVLLFCGGFLASHVLAGRLARPVERLALASAENLAGRTRAEAALELTTGELQRAARFSADASHQLKTPVTVLRAGLEELLARERFTPEECDEISALVHQTYRLSGLIEDLLLLSRMDAGRLKLAFARVDLSRLIEAAVDDLDATPDGLDLAIENQVPAALFVAGEKGYTAMILQNLLENARKYNHPRGRIRIAARSAGEAVWLTVGNTGRPIPVAMQPHIFERFHRGAIGENLPGYGLGLNLARELARLHRGELRLVCSEEAWTEFEVSFQRAATPVADRLVATL